MRHLTFTMARAIDELAFHSREKREDEKKKSSLLTAWTDEARSLFELLSARSWSKRGKPKLNDFVIGAIRDKKPQRAIALIEKKSRRWEGMASHNGLVEFFTQGFQAADFTEEPGGFTAFMCRPRDFIRERTDSEKKQVLQDVFGATGELSEESLKALIKKEWFLPSNRYEAMEQLGVTIDLLDLLTTEGGIASAGYRRGLSLLSEHSRQIKLALERDRYFLWKYVHLLDSIFQRFCDRLIRYAARRNPIVEARRDRLDEFQSDLVDRALSDFFELGFSPRLTLPGALERQTRKVGDDKRKVEAIGNHGGAKGEPGPRNAPKKARLEMTKNPSPEAGWRIPEGKKFADIFGKGMLANQVGFPRLHHHTRKEFTNLCIKFQVIGECSRGDGCPGAHVPPSQMSPEEKEKIAARFREVYGS